MLFIIFIIVLLYVILIGSLIYGFDKVSASPLKDIPAKTKFSIVVPFRNEVKNLPILLKSLSQLNYPKHLYEILLVNDESTDGSIEHIDNLLTKKPLSHIADNISIINNQRRTNSPKKDAITTAIQLAKYDWIVTTDADCKVPKYWLDAFDCQIQQNDPNLLVAPLTLDKANSFFERFQMLDILSLQGATIGGFGIKKPFLCNGANLVYKASVFESVNGYNGNDHIASGDDIFLLEKFLTLETSKVQYMMHNQVIVTTNPQPDFKSLKSQRVRWAAKTSSYDNTFGKFVGFIVLLMNALLVCLPILYLAHMISVKTLVYTFAIKCLIDFLLLFKSARFFGQESYLASYLFSCILYPLFSVYVAFLSVFKRYKWKDRTYSK